MNSVNQDENNPLIDINQLAKSGKQAFKLGKYSTAIKYFQEYLDRSNSDSYSYFEQKQWLVKAHIENGDLETAYQLCESLSNCPQEIIQIWARQYINKLKPNNEQEKEIQIVEPQFQFPSLRELERFNQKNLVHYLKECEQKRYWTLITLFVAICLLFSVIYLIDFDYVLAFIILWCGIVFCLSAIDTYRHGIKSGIIKNIIDFIDQDRRFITEKYGDRDNILNSFINSRLIQKSDRQLHLFTEDYITANINGISMGFSDIFLVKDVYSWLNIFDLSRYLQRSSNITDLYFYIPIYLLFSWVKVIKAFTYVIKGLINRRPFYYHDFYSQVIKKGISQETIFKGLFLHGQLVNHHNDRLIILPKKINHHPLFNQHNRQLVVTKNREFDNLFAVYSNDSLKARDLISHQLISLMIDFNKNIKLPLYLSLNNNSVYLAVGYHQSSLEPKLWKSMVNFQPVSEYFQIIKLLVKVVQEIQSTIDR